MAWIVENALRGAAGDQLVEVLTEQGVPTADATEQVRQVLSSPVLDGARKILRRSAGVEQASRLRRSLEALHTLEVDELDDERFFQLAWTAHRPVLLRGVASSWPQWTLDGLEQAYGNTQIEVLRGRSKHPRWWRRREELRTELTLTELLQEMRSTEGNDVYGVARNDVLSRMPELLADTRALPGIDPAQMHPFLWIGPAGTLTPLHHDQSSAWLVQRIGEKRVWLASPLEPALMDTTDGIFNTCDPREPAKGDAREVTWWETVLTPGDAIFLPTGWWHQVLALSPSVSISLGGFRWPNACTWYTPGRYEG